MATLVELVRGLPAGRLPCSAGGDRHAASGCRLHPGLYPPPRSQESRKGDCRVISGIHGQGTALAVRRETSQSTANSKHRNDICNECSKKEARKENRDIAQ